MSKSFKLRLTAFLCEAQKDIDLHLFDFFFKTVFQNNRLLLKQFLIRLAAASLSTFIFKHIFNSKLHCFVPSSLEENNTEQALIWSESSFVELLRVVVSYPLIFFFSFFDPSLPDCLLSSSFFSQCFHDKMEIFTDAGKFVASPHKDGQNIFEIYIYFFSYITLAYSQTECKFEDICSVGKQITCSVWFPCSFPTVEPSG